MRILVYGAGAIGSYLGAHLQQGGHDVTLVTRPAAAAAINSMGLHVSAEGQKKLVARPTAVDSLRQALLVDEPYDVVLLTMKAYDTGRALDEMVAFWPNPAPMIVFQNGIGIEEQFIEQYGRDRVVAGSVTTPVRLDAAGNVAVERQGRGLALAPTDDQMNIQPWVELFNASGLITEAIADYHALKWSKVLLNIIANASAAILNRHPQLIYKNASTFRLEKTMLKEALVVMDRLKIEPVDLPGSPVLRLVWGLQKAPSFALKAVMTPMVGRGRGDKMPSFHMDLANHKGQSEVIYHNGAIATAGKEVGVITPVNFVFNDILVKLTKGEVEWSEYSGQPQRLVEAVDRFRKEYKARSKGS